MMSKATTVAQYLKSLPEERRKAVEAVRKVVLKNLDADYEECMLYGMIGYAVPHRMWPTGYHFDPTKPLMVAALASQKDNITVYLMSVYSDKAERAWFEKTWKATGRKLNMGSSCVRFKRLEDAALDVIGEAIRRVPARTYIERYVQTLAKSGRAPDGRKLKSAGTGSKAKSAKPPSKAAARPPAKQPSRSSKA